jgi:hypothetical protein
MAAGGILDLAEIARKRDLLVVADVLIVEDEDGVAVHSGVNRFDRVPRKPLLQIDPGYFANEHRMELPYRNRHWRHLPQILSQLECE